MGQITEDIIDGTCCELCNCYFKNDDEKDPTKQLYSHGFPVVCWDCWDDLSFKDKSKHTRAIYPTF